LFPGANGNKSRIKKQEYSDVAEIGWLLCVSVIFERHDLTNNIADGGERAF
jgi:hypothetical protein